MKKDVIIIGGGVIGCSIALRLAQAGLKVGVIERGRAGCEASRAAAGMLSPQTEASGPGPFFDLCLRSHSMYRDFAAQITELSGIDVEYRDEGALFLMLENEDEKSVEGWASWQRKAGLAIERVSADDVRKIEPAITRSTAGAVYIPGDNQIENRLLMDALDVAVRRAGVEMLEGEAVDSLIMDGNRVIGVLSERARSEADTVIVAAGCWSGHLLERAGLDLEVSPAKGQMVAIKSEPSLLTATIHSRLCYMVPRRDGRILIGSTTEYVGYKKGVTASAVSALLAAAIEIIPALEDAEIVETWSGLRPDTSDHLPVMGFSGVDNLLIATGHFRNGILLAPVTSTLIADGIINGRVPEELRHFSIERFDSSDACMRERAAF